MDLYKLSSLLGYKDSRMMDFFINTVLGYFTKELGSLESGNVVQGGFMLRRVISAICILSPKSEAA